VNPGFIWYRDLWARVIASISVHDIEAAAMSRAGRTCKRPSAKGFADATRRGGVFSFLNADSTGQDSGNDPATDRSGASAF